MNDLLDLFVQARRVWYGLVVVQYIVALCMLNSSVYSAYELECCVKTVSEALVKSIITHQA